MNKILFFLSLFILSVFTTFSQDTARGLIIKSNNTDTIGANYALVVGISSYANINHLLYADDDAYLFAEYLINEKVCEKKNVVRLVDSVATTANFYKELTRIKNKIQPNDRVFIYFAGHGDVETDLESGFLLTYNSESNNYPATAIDISMLEKYVNAFVNKKVKVVLITDACRSGNLAGGLNGASTTMSSITKGFQNSIKILSCQPAQLSLEKNYPEGGHGVFTYHLVDGLKGMADSDGDSSISLREIGYYLDKVRAETNKKQIPKVDGDPEKNVASFDETLLLALLATKKDNSSIALNTFKKERGSGDSIWISNPYYQAFNEHIRKSAFIEPQGHNALFVIDSARKNKQHDAMIQDMKLELSALLEDEAQKWINKYLRGELENQPDIVLHELKKVSGYLETVESLIGENDLRFTEIHVKKIFFDAFAGYNVNDRTSYDKSILELEKANALLPNQAWIYYLMASIKFRQKKYAEAEAAFKNACKLAPSWSYPWNGLGILYVYQKNYPQSEAAYKKAIELDSNLVYPWYNLGLQYYDLQRYPEAEAAYRKAIQVGPDYVYSWFDLGRLYKKINKYPEAEAAYKQGIQIDSNVAYPWNNLGNLYSDLKRYAEAEAAYKKAIQIDPNFRGPWYNSGNLYRTLTKYAEAEAAYKKAIQIDPNYANPYYDLAILYVIWGKQEASLEFFELSFQKGFKDFSGIETNQDLDNIRNVDAFKKLIEKYTK